jgi:hypothetical protein
MSKRGRQELTSPSQRLQGHRTYEASCFSRCRLAF